MRSHKPEIAVLGGFILLTALLFRDAWRSPTDTWVGAAGDPPLFMWFLRWSPYALTHGLNPLISDYLNAPDGVNLMWNTPMPLPALVLAPLTLLFGPVVAYNTLVTLGVALSGWCAYLMLRRYVPSRFAALTGAFLYGFSPYVMGHAGEHANLPSAFTPPLMFLLLDEILVRQRRPPVLTGLALGGLAFVQLLSSSELLATEFLVALLGLLLLIILYPREVSSRAPKAAAALTVALGSALVLSAAPLGVMFFGRQRVRTGALWGSDFFVTDLVGLVIPRGYELLKPQWTGEITKHFSDACCPAESGTYLGLPLIVVLIVVTATQWSKPLVRFAGLLAATTALFSMGPHLHVRGQITPLRLPFSIMTDVPVVNNMLAGRLMLYVYLMAALLVAIAINGVRGSSARWRGAVALAAVALVPLVPDPDFPTSPSSTPKFFRSGAVRSLAKGSVVLIAPFARDTNTSEPMLWQAEADMRFRMPSGYVIGPDRNGKMSYLPIATTLSTTMEQIQRGTSPPQIDEGARRVLLADLAAMGATSVIVGPMQNREAMVSFFRELLDRDPRQVEGVQLWTLSSASL